MGGRPVGVRARRVEVVRPPLQTAEEARAVEVATALLPRVEADLAIPGHEVGLVVILAVVTAPSAPP